jgi:hypothetical protein
MPDGASELGPPGRRAEIIATAVNYRNGGELSLVVEAALC